VTSRIHLTTQEVLMLLFAPLLLWVATVVAAVEFYPDTILNIAASLAGAWSMIRLGSGTIRSRGHLEGAGDCDVYPCGAEYSWLVAADDGRAR
jgi:hypothetical protein